MKHAYLTKEEIDRSYQKGAITVREARELRGKLNVCTKVGRRRNVERHGGVTLHSVI